MAMVMIDFTIVSISVTTIQRDLHLSATAAQWTVTAYALSTAAFIALGGRLGDIIGHKRIVASGSCCSRELRRSAGSSRIPGRLSPG
jgi:MFS family permease